MESKARVIDWEIVLGKTCFTPFVGLITYNSQTTKAYVSLKGGNVFTPKKEA